jgi:NAD(P)-dependent dehydrogenase (short-subunit alcohol dehydrogenase family)
MRSVVVTGGGHGIGRAIVEQFAQEGDRVLALGRDEDALSNLRAALARSAGEVTTARCDVTDEADVRDSFAEPGAVDILVNNAGIAESAALHRTSLADWQRHLDVNATGAFLCTRAVIDAMRHRGTGAIVTVASTAGKAGAPYTAAYAASKHAAVGLMRVAAAELAGTGATANAVCPTFVDTEMTRRSVARIAERTGRTEQQGAEALAAAAPLGRLLAAEEVAAAVVWLASDAARGINGQTLVIDGGGIQQ